MSVGRTTKAVIEICVVVLVCLALIEVFSYFFPKIFYEFEYRYLSCSRNSLHNIDDKYWSYTPNTQVRSVTIYKYPGTKPIIEGDVLFKTNSLGLVQQYEVDKDKPTIAILGDSFTEGQLCDPWFFQLEDEFRKNNFRYQLMNFGLMSTGPQHWELFLADTAKDYTISKVLIIFIQNDFERGVSSWDQHQLDCINTGVCTDDYWYGIDVSTSHDDIIAATDARERGRHGGSLTTKIDGFLRRWLHSYRYLRATIKSISDASAFMDESAYKSAVIKNLDAIRKVVSEVGKQNVEFLAVSTRPEAERQEFEERTKSIMRELSSMTSSGQMHSVMLHSHDFFEYDGHPNASGYEKIKNKTAAILTEMSR